MVIALTCVFIFSEFIHQCWNAHQTATYFALAKTLSTVAEVSSVLSALDSLDDHLAFRTFLVGHSITAADWMLWGSIRGNDGFAPESLE